MFSYHHPAGLLRGGIQTVCSLAWLTREDARVILSLFAWLFVVVLVRDMMEYVGFAVNYDDDQDW